MPNGTNITTTTSSSSNNNDDDYTKNKKLMTMHTNITTTTTSCSSNNNDDDYTKNKMLMTMHKALHPRDDIARQYVSRKDGREEDLPASKTALTHRYNDLKIT